ncbi:MAG: hypothetical protein Q9220_004263 [cf. Caloplaca sp. 1 TL-2023]
MSIGHYLNNVDKLTKQWTRNNYRDRDRQRLYLKDIDCPQVWHDKLKEAIPPSIFYLNDSTGDPGGPGSVDELNPHAPGLKKGRGVAKAGDLMSCLPPAMRADNLMCYIGHEGTYTPAHREMCASLGQNLMVETSGALDLNGKPTKPGSSIWFMTESKDRHLVSEYWLSTLGHDIEVEAHFAQINAWKSAPFTTYIVEQKLGDFILIPPLAPHQVWNRGTRTMKVAWNRTTVETLELALEEALPRARMVGRDEQYKNKAMVYFALEHYSALLTRVDYQKRTVSNEQLILDLKYSPKIRQLHKDFRRLFILYTRLVLSEALPTNQDKKIQYIQFDSNITCSFCRCNIFNRFLTCPTCIVPLQNGEEDTYDICLECYAMGRSCRCISGYKWVEQFRWQELADKHERWRQQIIAFDGGLSERSPQPLHMERHYMEMKSLAQVCQEQLKLRPWNDPSKPAPEPKLSKDADESQVNADGTITVKKRKPQAIEKGYAKNHVSNYPEPIWKLGVCNSCDRAYSYGNLFRAFDTMPLTVMENPKWQCPHCQRICSCGKCRKVAGMQPFEPTGTVLGYDTRRVADPRSTESLVDFRQSNFEWVKKAGDNVPVGEETRRLSRRFDEAEAAKSQGDALDNNNYVNEDEDAQMANGHAVIESPTTRENASEIPIDPLLGGLPPNGTSSVQRNDNGDDGALHNGVDHEPPHRFVAPAAIMLNQGSIGGSFERDANGIVFQYPDPTDAELDTTVPQYAPPQVEQQPRPKGRTEHSKKRKRSDVRDKVLGDSLDSNDANEQYHKAQIRSTLAEAKRNNRYIIAEAAISGKSMSLKFKIHGTQLARITSQDPIQTAQPPVQSRASIPMVQSDYPSPGSKIKPPNDPMKRARIERDDDFATRSNRRKQTGPRSNLAEEPSKKAPKYMDITSGSEDEEAINDEGTHTENSASRPRPLPAYLARKNDMGDQEIPKELSMEVKQRPSRRKTTFMESAIGARSLVEENRQAKLRAMQWDNSDSNSEEASDHDSSPEKQLSRELKEAPSFTKPVSKRPVQNGSSSVPSKPKSVLSRGSVPTSIFSKGKKVRIVSAKQTLSNGKPARRSLGI